MCSISFACSTYPSVTCSCQHPSPFIPRTAVTVQVHTGTHTYVRMYVPPTYTLHTHTRAHLHCMVWYEGLLRNLCLYFSPCAYRCTFVWQCSGTLRRTSWSTCKNTTSWCFWRQARHSDTLYQSSVIQHVAEVVSGVWSWLSLLYTMRLYRGNTVVVVASVVTYMHLPARCCQDCWVYNRALLANLEY